MTQLVAVRHLWLTFGLLVGTGTFMVCQSTPGPQINGSSKGSSPAKSAGPGSTRANTSKDDEDLHVYTDHPRLFLTKARLRLLQRERERQSPRWQQFDALVSGGAISAESGPEPGFAWALHYQVAGDRESGRKAVNWALGAHPKRSPESELRQLAIVFDWCGPLMSEAQAAELAAKIREGAEAAAGQGSQSRPGIRSDIARTSAVVLAAIAIADALPDHGEGFLRPIVSDWRSNIAPGLEKGTALVPREQLYALFEMLHALRDNLKLDLREDASDYFRLLPLDHLEAHYPATFQGQENDFRVSVYVRDGEPDVDEAVLSRAVELAMVAYETNAIESQYLQGWLMQDRFMMRGAFGAPYEFMWANPYQPGLSYFHAPLVFHDSTRGTLFARTSWEEDATWLGYFEGHLQLFRDGKIESLRPGAGAPPIQIGETMILTMRDKKENRFQLNSPLTFLLGLEPRSVYEVEVDDQELIELNTDNGGIMTIELSEATDKAVWIKLRP